MSQPDQVPAKATLTATYTSLSNQPFQISQHLDIPTPSSDPAPEERKKQQRIQSLSQLRKAASTIQAAVNKELTARMEEDKARELASNQGVVVIDDEAEEQNYGEEVVEDSD
ncbi:Gon7 family protein [Rhypophila sp. PSN 637]